MTSVRIAQVATAHPPYRLDQQEAAQRIGLAAGNMRRVQALARGTRIRTRAMAMPPDEISSLGSIAARNSIYREVAPRLASEAAHAACSAEEARHLSALVTSSCTGYALPGWGSGLVREMALGCDTMRLPITEAGCAGGALALARATDYLRTRPGHAAMAVATEICSLAFHPGGTDGNLVATLIFGDGAGAAMLATGDGPGLEVIDTASMLVPDTETQLGFDLTDNGFYPVLARDLTASVVPAAGQAVMQLLGRNGLHCDEVGAWLIHPGGARILSGIEQALGLRTAQTRWSWDSMAEYGNTSSAAIYDVLRRYLADAEAPRGWAVIAAFGPGVAVELLLVRRTC